MIKLPQHIQKFITENSTAHVATISEDNNWPQVATTYYVFDNNSIYLVTRPESRKIKNIAANNHIALVITDSSKLITLQIECISEIVKDIKLKTIIVKTYSQTSHNANPGAFTPLMKTVGSSVEVVKCTINWYRYSDFSGSKQIMLEHK